MIEQSSTVSNTAEFESPKVVPIAISSPAKSMLIRLIFLIDSIKFFVALNRQKKNMHEIFLNYIVIKAHTIHKHTNTREIGNFFEYFY